MNFGQLIGALMALTVVLTIVGVGIVERRPRRRPTPPRPHTNVTVHRRAYDQDAAA